MFSKEAEGPPPKTDAIARRIKKLLLEAGLRSRRLTPHSFRGGAATKLKREGIVETEERKGKVKIERFTTECECGRVSFRTGLPAGNILRRSYSEIKTEGTHFRLTHRGCNGQTLKCRCIKCHTVCGGTCSVCDGTLLHMTWFCRKCHHAAHPHHMLEWFTTQRVCPVANCMCECGTNVVQTPQEKKITVARNKTLEAIREVGVTKFDSFFLDFKRF
ncbi:unnamed protein product [Cylicostephanus goldi]|uniref:GATOR2 complex protein MIO zinc-ribbon like domain-containing protein n=1 Tax=Cylicostephanus goldi TaxID=71465 RepID=A0A3P7Q6X4_CYLGO|nr:unnamed protein product [Cylicostephanus goldi]